LKEVDGIVYEADCAMITLGAVQVGLYREFPRWLWTRLIEIQTLVPTRPQKKQRRVSRMALSRLTTS
jgi:hypothetical protein